MPTKIIRNHGHITALADILGKRKLPLTVSWVQGASLSRQQQRLSFRWYQDIANQLGDQNSEEVRAHCKVTFGVPILAADDDAFRERWNQSVGAHDYEAQRDIVRLLQIPVTSLMTTQKMGDYLNQIVREYLPQGVRLTDPEALKYESEFGPAVQP